MTALLIMISALLAFMEHQLISSLHSGGGLGLFMLVSLIPSRRSKVHADDPKCPLLTTMISMLCALFWFVSFRANLCVQLLILVSSTIRFR